MIGIVIFLAVIGVAAGYAVWNDRRTPWRDPVPERREPRISPGSL